MTDDVQLTISEFERLLQIDEEEKNLVEQLEKLGKERKRIYGRILGRNKEKEGNKEIVKSKKKKAENTGNANQPKEEVLLEKQKELELKKEAIRKEKEAHQKEIERLKKEKEQLAAKRLKQEKNTDDSNPPQPIKDEPSTQPSPNQESRKEKKDKKKKDTKKDKKTETSAQPIPDAEAKKDKKKKDLKKDVPSQPSAEIDPKKKEKKKKDTKKEKKEAPKKVDKEEPKVVCEKCGKTISPGDASVKMNSKIWHKACFVCYKEGCDIVLELSNFVAVNDLPYCTAHSKSSPKKEKKKKEPKKEKKDIKEKKKVNAAAKSDQVACATCGAPLEGSYASMNGKPYCKVHYIEEFKKMGIDYYSITGSSTKSAAAAPKPKTARDTKKDTKKERKSSKPKNKETKSASSKRKDKKDTSRGKDKDKKKKEPKKEKTNFHALRARFAKPKDAGEMKRSASVIVRGTGSSKRFSRKIEKCTACCKSVYHFERINVEGKIFHKPCLRCKHCQMVLKLGTYASLHGEFYCKPHFKQLFMKAGNYNEGFGQKRLTLKWSEKTGKETSAVFT